MLRANRGNVGRDPTHIYCNVALFLLHTLQFITANYITWFSRMGYKNWYLYVNHSYKTFLKIILDLTENVNVLMTHLFLENTWFFPATQQSCPPSSRSGLLVDLQELDIAILLNFHDVPTLFLTELWNAQELVENNYNNISENLANHYLTFFSFEKQ